jgi:hypothetical protein
VTSGSPSARLCCGFGTAALCAIAVPGMAQVATSAAMTTMARTKFVRANIIRLRTVLFRSVLMQRESPVLCASEAQR